jgi:putative tricarboxylic transport membrane protein
VQSCLGKIHANGGADVSLDVFLNPEVWILIAAGSVLGYFVGILPGLDGTTAIALLAPLGLYLDSGVVFYFYASLLGSVTFAGSVPAILFNIPGEAICLVTTFDGFPMSRQGRAMEALSISAVATALGAFISVGFLILSLPVARQIVMLFGPAEKFWLVMCAFVLVPFVGGTDTLKGLVAVTLGLVLASIGRSVVTGEFRYTFGASYLDSGLNLIPFLAIGMFAIRVVLGLISTPEEPISIGSVKVDLRQIRKGAIFVFKQPLALIRASFIGTVIGVIPGIGPVTATFMSYIAARGSSKNPETFGKGNPAGVLASEAANNAEQGGAAITSLLLGIPGNLDWAVLLGIMVMYGIMPGPDLLVQNPGVVWGIVWGVVIGNVISSTIGLLAGTQLARLTVIKPMYIVPFVFIPCMLGAYLINNSIWDCMIAIIGGLLGYCIQKQNYELLPFALGFILGPYIERNFYMAFQVGYHRYTGFVDSATSIILLIFCVAVVIAGPSLRRRLMRGVSQ